jgi:hypothetical protein
MAVMSLTEKGLSKERINLSMGNYGGKYSGAGTITPSSGYIFNAIEVLTDSVLTCVSRNIEGITNVTLTLTPGIVLYGEYTSITITSGTVMAYHGGV